MYFERIAFLLIIIVAKCFLYRLTAANSSFQIFNFKNYSCQSPIYIGQNSNSHKTTFFHNRQYKQAFLFSTSSYSFATTPPGTGSTSGTDPTLSEELYDEDELLDELPNETKKSPSSDTPVKDAKAAVTTGTVAAEEGEAESEDDLEDSFNQEALAAEEELVAEEVASAVAADAAAAPAAESQAMSAANLLSGLLDRPPPRPERRTLVIPFGYALLR